MNFLRFIRTGNATERLPNSGTVHPCESHSASTAASRKNGHFGTCNGSPPAGRVTALWMRGVRVSATDGPYVETKEQLGASIPPVPRRGIGSALPGRVDSAVYRSTIVEDSGGRRVSAGRRAPPTAQGDPT